MPDQLYLAVDCSTTASKAVVFTSEGRSVSTARRPIEMSRPRAGWHEQHAEHWWTATRDAIRDVVATLADPQLIVAMCISHQRESFVCLDATGQPLRPAILWLDSRATREIAELGTAEVARVSGKPADTTSALYKLAWLHRHEATTLTQATLVGDVHAYLARRLTGRWATSTGSADSLGMMDLSTLGWSEQLLTLAGVRAGQLPELVPAGEPIALLRHDIARTLGLPRPIPLVAGTGDGQAAGLGADAGRNGTAYLNLGTSMVAGVTVAGAGSDAALRSLAAPVQGEVVLESVLNSAGYLVEWFGREIGDPSAADAAASAIPPGSDGLLTLPYWNRAQSPHWNAAARGATVGWHGGHTTAHFYRSMLEGVAFELRLHLESLERAAAQPLTTLVSVGGGSKSVLWQQIIADVTGRTIHTLAEDEASAKGAAVIAHAFVTGRGNAGITAAATEFAVPPRSTVTAQTAATAAYEALLPVHRSLYTALVPVFDLLPDGTRQ